MLTWRPGPFHRALHSLPVNFPPVTVTTGIVSTPIPAADVTAPQEGLAAVLTARKPEYRPEPTSRLGHWRRATRDWFRRL